MPIYEFVCEPCDKVFEVLFRSSTEKRKVTCPDCGKNSVYMKLGVDDGYCCRTSGCWFWAYASGSDTVDVANRARLRGVNACHPQRFELREVDFSQPDTEGAVGGDMP